MASKIPLVLSSTGVLQQVQTGDSIPVSVGGTGATTVSGAKQSLGLDQVENKSSATIRGELTSSNVTTALGYTPAVEGSGGGIITGTTTIDFGTAAAGGKQEVDLVITGATAIATMNHPQACLELVATSTHSVKDHMYAALFLALTCDTVVAGTGFTIHARSTQKLTGSFTVRWYYF